MVVGAVGGLVAGFVAGVVGAIVDAIVDVTLGVAPARAAGAPSAEIAAGSGASASRNSEGSVLGAAGFVATVFGGAGLGVGMRGAAPPGAKVLGAAVLIVATPDPVAGAVGHGAIVLGESTLRSCAG